MTLDLRGIQARISQRAEHQSEPVELLGWL